MTPEEYAAPGEHPAPEPYAPSAEYPAPDRDPAPDLDLLAAMGRVDPPDARVLDAARETLWSVVAEEMLGAAVAEARTRGTGRDQAGQRRREHPGP